MQNYKFSSRMILIALLPLISNASIAADDSNSVKRPLMNEAETLALDAKHYAASYHVSIDEAMRRLLIMHGTEDQLTGLQESYGNKLSGIYFDNGQSFGLNIRMKGSYNAPKTTRLVKKPNLNIRKLKSVNPEERKLVRKINNLTETEVETAYTVLEKGASSPVIVNYNAPNTKKERNNSIFGHQHLAKKRFPAIEMVLDDEQTGNVLVYVSSLKNVQKSELEQIFKAKVDLIEIPGGIQATKTRGGSWLVKSSNGGNYCMTGFTAKRISNGDLGVITAGHCISSTTPLNYKDKDGTDYAISPISGMAVNDASMDLAFLKAGTSKDQQAVPQFYADSTTTPRALTGKRNRSSTDVKSSTVKGSYVCHLGQTSNTDSTLVQSCGEVTSITGANHIGGNTFVVVSNTQSGAGTDYSSGLGTLRCVPGDSGGPWFAFNVAFGIQSACTWKNKDKTIASTVIYTSVDYLSDIGAQLVYQ